MIRPVNGSGMKRMALLNDLSCFGKCSLSVAMPILSACGVETVPLPTVILSTHTASGFGDYVMRDMTDEMKAFAAHWKKLDVKFDGICTGFFASAEQIRFAESFLRDFGGEDTLIVVDPVLGDNGALYGCFSEEYVQAMRTLCKAARLITPNHTEAALLAGCSMDTDVNELLEKLPVENVIITGVAARGDRLLCASGRGIYGNFQTLHSADAAQHGRCVRLCPLRRTDEWQNDAVRTRRCSKILRRLRAKNSKTRRGTLVQSRL